MLTIENLMAALPTDDRFIQTFPGLPGWSTCAYWAARCTDYPSGATVSEAPEHRVTHMRGLVAEWTNTEHVRVDVVEDPSLALPFVPGAPDQHDGVCGTCNGEAEHDCSCGDTHDCGDCDGYGYENLRRGIPEKLGQSVWRSADGTETAIQARATELLRGYRVVRYGVTSTSPLMGLNEAGEVMIVVMPRFGIERPETTAAVPASEPTP